MKLGNATTTRRVWSLMSALILACTMGIGAVRMDDGGVLQGLASKGLEAKKYSEWDDPINLGPVLNSPSDDNHPAVSKDGLSLFFHSNRPGGFGGEDIYVSQRLSLDATWGQPVNLGPNVNTSSNDRVPAFSANGRWMFFGSTRPGGQGGLDLWASRRTDKKDDFSWQPPINLGPVINSPSDDDGATLFEDEGGTTTLYFASNRPGGPGDFDIYSSQQKEDGSFETASLVVELTSPQRDTRTAIRSDGLEILITSNRPGSQGLDLWVSTRKNSRKEWTTPVRLEITVNSPANDGAPTLSSNGRTMYFYSNRPGGSGGNDLYMTTRKKLRGGDS